MRRAGLRTTSAASKSWMAEEAQFDALLDALAGLAAANIVLVETLHEHQVIDKTHFAHAFGRALDTLAPEHRGGMIEHVLRNMRDRCMDLPAGGTRSDAQEWLSKLLR